MSQFLLRVLFGLMCFGLATCLPSGYAEEPVKAKLPDREQLKRSSPYKCRGLRRMKHNRKRLRTERAGFEPAEGFYPLAALAKRNS